MGIIATAGMYARFMAGLPAYLRGRTTLDDSRAMMARGLAERSENFLRVARLGIYENTGSFYLPLLRKAGCELGDLEREVRARGLESTLERLRQEGVYVTFEEFKGRTPIVRGTHVHATGDHDFDNPLVRRAFSGRTGGSTGTGSRVETDLDNLVTISPHLMMGRHVHGLLGLPMAVWHGALPDPTGTGVCLRAARYRGQPQRWFTPVTDSTAGTPLRFRLANAYIVLMSHLCGVPCPWPEPLPLGQAEVLARWAAETASRHGGLDCCRSCDRTRHGRCLRGPGTFVRVGSGSRARRRDAVPHLHADTHRGRGRLLRRRRPRRGAREPHPHPGPDGRPGA